MRQTFSLRYFIAILTILVYLPDSIASTVSPLGQTAEISLLTCSPGKEVWANYGHTAIRVNDPENHRDFTFNYGVFDFNSSHFLWKFVSGQTDYILGVSKTGHFIDSYQEENRRVSEQILNLTPQEKEKLWEALYTNSLPQNRSYRYNFFYDNCATRARVIIEQSINGKVFYDTTAYYHSMRDVVRHYTLDYPWTWFGISFAVSSPADKSASWLDQLFAPELMMFAFDKAEIDSLSINNNLRPLVGQTTTLCEIQPGNGITSQWWKYLFHPIVVCWVLFLLTLLIEIKEIRQRKRNAFLDGIIFGIAGILGILIAFLAFISVHPAVQQNYLLVWLHPLHFIFAVALCFRPFRKGKIPYVYLKINFPFLLFALIGVCFLPQYFHPAFLPLLLILLSRSILGFANMNYPCKKR